MSDRTPPLTWRECLVHFLILAALLVPTFPRVFFRGELLSSADILFKLPPWERYAPRGFQEPQNQLMFDPLMAFRPDYLLVQHALRTGEWPLWNPYEYSGVPLLANCQSTALYPLRLLLLLTDVDTAMTLFVLLKLWLCGVNAYWCARLIGINRWPARFFSVAWMVGSHNLIWANWPIGDVACWLPVLFLGVESLLDGRYRRGFFATALGGTLILYAGHPETAFTMSLGTGIYFVMRLVYDWSAFYTDRARMRSVLNEIRAARGRLGMLGRFPFVALQNTRWPSLFRHVTVATLLAGAAWVLALSAYAPQLLPFVEYLQNSYTVAERDLEHTVDMPEGALLALWVPRFFGTFAEDTWWDKGKYNSNIVGKQYLGMVTLCGLGFLMVSARSELKTPRRKGRIVCLVLASIFVNLLGYNVWPVAHLNQLPVMNSLLEIYHVCFGLFALPLAAALGLERWFSRPRKHREVLWAAPILGAGAFFVPLAIRFYWQLLGAARAAIPGLGWYVALQIAIAVAFGAAAACLFLASCGARRAAPYWIAAILLLAADHWVACRGLNPTMPRELLYCRTELTDYLASLPKPCRIGVAQGNFVSGASVNYGIEEWLGYDGLYPERVMRYQVELGHLVWQVMEPVNSIQYYLSDPMYPPLFPLEQLLSEGRIEKVAERDHIEVYRNRGALPRAFLVGNLEVIPDRDALFDRMRDRSYNPKVVAVTEVHPETPLPRSNQTHVGDATVRDYRMTRVAVEYEATDDAVLVLADQYYPGWKARLDGRPIEMFPVYYNFRGIIVPPGRHTVEYVYFPNSLRFGLGIASVALFLSACVCVYILWTGRAVAVAPHRSL